MDTRVANCGKFSVGYILIRPKLTSVRVLKMPTTHSGVPVNGQLLPPYLMNPLPQKWLVGER